MKKQLFKVRRAALNDALKIRNLHVYSIRRLCSNTYTPKQIDALTKHRHVRTYLTVIIKKKEFIYVAQNNSKIVGFIVFYKNEVKALYVHPNYIRKGIAHSLLKKSEKLIQQQGNQTIHLKSTINATSFYMASGYTRTKRTNHILKDGTKIPCIQMRKEL